MIGEAWCRFTALVRGGRTLSVLAPRLASDTYRSWFEREQESVKLPLRRMLVVGTRRQLSASGDARIRRESDTPTGDWLTVGARRAARATST